MLILGYCATPAAAAPVLDASCPGPGTLLIAPAVRNAQTFVAQNTGDLVFAQMGINKFSGGGGWTMTLYATDGLGNPTNVALGSAAIPDSAVPGGASLLTGAFSPAPSVVAGQGYALSLTRSPALDFAVQARDGDICPGRFFFSTSAGGAWTAGSSSHDLVFTTSVEPPAGPEPVDAEPPQSTITKGPKDKTRKKNATFEFTGTDARVISGFQCKLDAGAFAPCTSPHTVKVKKGKHTFEVRAVDEAGNVGSPATDTWKRKKKKK